MAKLIFFDIDGTLWDERMKIPESTKETIKELKENGHKTFICSGRAKSNINDEELLSLGFDGIVAACGNHVEMDGKILYEYLIPSETVKEMVRLFDECGMPVVLEGPQKHWISPKGFEADPFINYLFESMGETAVQLNGHDQDIVINKFSADVLPTTDYQRLRKELDGKFDFIEHDGVIIEVVPKGSSKATGIKWLCEYLGVDISDTYGIGDSANDLDMLSFVGHGIAMGNGSKAAKDAAEYITTDIHEDGIRHAMEHYGLISN